MNYRVILSTVGKAILALALFLAFPLIVGFIYQENSYLSFLIPMGVAIVVGLPLSLLNGKERTIYQKEGFVIVALVWIVMSLIGALPFVISGTIPNYIDAFFETVSGFTTTGASILTGEQVDAMYLGYKSVMFWRMFTHWIGGMGVLVFLLALLPGDNAGIMHVFRAEAPGPSASKFVSKMRVTARILYAIYFVMTVIQIVMLWAGGMPFYDSVVYSFSTAGTGGFAITGTGVPIYNSAYVEIVMAVFMFLFGLNFNVYYFILIKNFSKAFKCEEMRGYLIIVALSTLLIALNILSSVSSFGEALRLSFFQVTSISSTTGLSTADFTKWPALSKGILLFLTIIGACGGSTGGGVKVSRMIVLFKSSVNDMRKMVHPRSVLTVKFEGEKVDKDTVRNVRLFFILWVGVVILSTLILSVDSFSNGDVFTDFSSVLACIGNVGPGLTNLVGPMSNYGGYSAFSKIILSLDMLAGRLELFPIIILFTPRTWIKHK